MQMAGGQRHAIPFLRGDEGSWLVVLRRASQASGVIRLAAAAEGRGIPIPTMSKTAARRTLLDEHVRAWCEAAGLTFEEWEVAPW